MTSPPPSVPDWLKSFRPDQVRTLDPRRHALIEASAGTGKTFAIEHLVLRLLVENPAWNPEEILLLSFTEKTVAELLDRIRRLLRAQIDGSDPRKRLEGWGSGDIDRLRQLWLHADDLSIHTLHAFCQAALRRDPVVNNALIRAPLTDDAPMADAALDRLLRGPWAKDPLRLDKLTRALGIGAGDAWRKKLMRLTLKWQPWRFDTLDPECDPGTLDALEAEAETAADALAGAIQAVNCGGFPTEAYRRSFAFTKTGQHAAKADEALQKHAYQKVFLFAENDPANADVLKFFLKKFDKRSKAVKNGWAGEIPAAAGGAPEWERLSAVCHQLRMLAERVEEARAAQRLGLLAEAARELRAALDEEKLRRGLISYEDMPRNLVEALRRNPALADRLRSRYKACIVDEFQDTDPLQWEILEAFCLSEQDGETPRVPLFLVGDPKQAIYAFRGGDLRTYMAARARFHALAGKGRAQGVGLDANFRSRASLIGVLNETFATPEWFGPAPVIPPDPAWHLPGISEDIVFTPVRAGRPEGSTDPAPEKGPVREPAVWLRDFSAVERDEKGKPLWPGKTAVERDVREWIAARIAAALRDGDKTGAKAGDFAVLTRSNPEGEAIARRLRQRGVPCRIRRRGGPWSGPAADALRMLLEWIEDAASPDAQARILLLPFTGSVPNGRPDRCPPLIARWAALATAGRWPEFFESVQQEGGYRERLAAKSPEDAVRFERLVVLLSEAGAAPGTTSRTLCERFDAMRRGEEVAAGDDAEGDGEQGSVSVMTLHLSKGLEFRHVFIAATGSGRKDDFLTLRDPGAKGFRIALDKDDTALQQRAESEARAEDKRLYYVGFTRARETLHVPILPQKFSRGGAGPLGDFVATALRTVAEEPATSPFVRFDEDPLWPGTLAPNSASLPTGASSAGAAPADRQALVLEARAAFDRRRQVSSYSGLARRAGEVPEIVHEVETLLDESGARAQRQEPEPEPPEDGLEAAPVITAEDLPPGAGAGTALHTILEHTVFTSVLEADSPEEWLALPANRERVEEALRRESVAPAHAPAAARAVWNTLRMPLPDPAGGPAFRLADLEGPQDYRHEVEFLLNFKIDPLRNSPHKLPESVSRRGDFLWGFMDLVYRRGGRYYLLDWKSNLLPGYDRDNVRHSMEAHRYDLQWKLYSVALDRWLEARLPGYEYTAHFGGVHYLYLRGSAPTRFSGFSERPTAKQLSEDFPAEIARLLGAETAEAR